MNIPRAALIGVGALIISTIGIQASDLLQGVDGNMASLLMNSEIESVCGEGAILLSFSTGQLCVDIYEASTSAECPVTDRVGAVDTATNVAAASCSGVSKAEQAPWTNVAFSEAQQLCARNGKRLPTPGEWFDIAVALNDQSSCVVTDGSPQLTGAAECVTTSGIHDVVGNVWEWVDATVIDGQYEGRTLPARGYVSVVDADGVVIETTESAQVEYGEDYAITSNTGTYGMIRGGFYDSGKDGGMFAQNLAVPFDLKTPGIGFRCVRSL